MLSVIVSLTALGSFSQTDLTAAVDSEKSSATDLVSRRLTVKTNAVGWGLAMVNAAVEYEFYPNWSVELPAYYSCWNYYGRSDRKFRGLFIQPEVKRYFGAHDRFGVGLHFGVGYYNWQYGDDYRYQTHKKRNPIGGAGVSFTYRVGFGGDSRWGLEVVLGLGAYLNDYDRYKTVPCTCDPDDLSHYVDGRCVCMDPEHVRKAFAGIDKLGVSVTYTIDFKRKK